MKSFEGTISMVNSERKALYEVLWLTEYSNMIRTMRLECAIVCGEPRTLCLKALLQWERLRNQKRISQGTQEWDKRYERQYMTSVRSVTPMV